MFFVKRRGRAGLVGVSASRIREAIRGMETMKAACTLRSPGLFLTCLYRRATIPSARYGICLYLIKERPHDG